MIRTQTKITRAALRAVSDFLPDRHAVVAAEPGGADSFVMRSILHGFSVRKYLVFDEDSPALSDTPEHAGVDYESSVEIHPCDLRAETLPEAGCGLVVSCGLLGRYGPENLEKIIAGHFRLAVSGGVVIFLFPCRSFAGRCFGWLAGEKKPAFLPDADHVFNLASLSGKLLRSETTGSAFLPWKLLAFAKN